MQCPRCGARNDKDVGSCEACGATMAKSPPAAATSRPAGARASAARVTSRASPKPRARVSAVSRDGSRSAEFVLVKEETRVGRAVGADEVKLAEDPFVAPVHALFRFEGSRLVIQDAGNSNGVFLWLRERELASGDELRIGRQRLRIEWMPEEREQAADQPIWGSPDPGYTARAVQILEGGGDGDVFPLKSGENLVGRGTGEVSFPHDGYVSSKHAAIVVGDGTLLVRDLGSANGTFLRVNGEASLSPGDLLLVGEQILRVDPA